MCMVYFKIFHKEGHTDLYNYRGGGAMGSYKISIKLLSYSKGGQTRFKGEGINFVPPPKRNPAIVINIILRI